MGKKENDAMRRKKNEHFIKAFKYIAERLKMTQGALAEAIGTKSSYISNFSKGLRPVPEETIEALITVSASKPGMQIFREYLYGNSDIMLLDNVSDKEMIAAQMRKDNPDYDTMERQRQEAESNVLKASHAQPTIEPGSALNAALAAYMQAIDMAKADKATLLEAHARELQQLRDQLEDKERIISEQEQRIAELKSRLIEYRKIIDANNGISPHPFPLGTAEERKRKQ